MKDSVIIDTYALVKNNQGGKLRSLIRSSVLDVLSLKHSILGNDEFLKKPRIQFLYFHHIFKDEVKNFEKLLAYLSKDHSFISHSEGVDRLLTDRIDKPYIAWSSDDGIQNNMLAAKVLNNYGASCCFYINPASIGLTEFTQIKSFSNDKLDMPPVAFLNWKEVELLQSQGHEIGNHTYKHDMVTQLTQEEFEEDFLKADEILTQKCGPIKHFAYTYGKFENFTKPAFEFVMKNGYESCISASRGCHTNGKGQLDKNSVFLRRDQIIADWKLSHIKHFLIKGAQELDYNTNFLPNSLA
ncbi:MULTISPECIES: polysaccharide deacetylase family protein [unclassified Maribacter]|mgnify:CR=1 FL=1|uniref:polysaccharide deacetylase family protein n=1 Tax=unclassified Maribacter TaxID=2615042 RepID=UPI002580568A|nr:MULTISPECIES: polysaccharide deacetylase family protein [unclassified Maribacter]|tara:strand:+ start:169344 stop:170237 length:894 start_codon:yes stop_codon:yes gene_type:complete